MLNIFKKKVKIVVKKTSFGYERGRVFHKGKKIHDTGICSTGNARYYALNWCATHGYRA